MASPETDIEIFRTGTHTAMNGERVTVTTTDLAEIAAAYDPARHEAPLVIGHPTTNGPAYGWVRGLRVEGDRLMATPQQVDPVFTELVRKGAYKKRSASFWGAKAPGNPSPGRLALRHVGFLGAMPPAVKGLRDCNFADDGDMVTFEFADQPQEKPGMDEETKKRIETAEAENRKLQDQLKAAEADKGKLADTLREFAERDRGNRQAADRTRLDGLVRDGRVLPREVERLTGLIQFLDRHQGDVLEFAEGSAAATVKISPKEMVFDLLTKRPAMVDFSERARGTTGAGSGSLDFADPVAIADAAANYETEMAKRGTPVTSAAAVLHVMQGRRS